MYSSVNLDVCDLNSSVKDVNHWTNNTGDLLIVVKACVEPVLFLEWAGNQGMVQQCAKDSLNNTPLNLEFFLLLDGLPYQV